VLESMDIIVRDADVKEELKQKILAASDEIYVTSSIKQLVEISYKDAGKKSGVQYVADLLGVRREEVAAFGDADNDVDMIEYAGCGIAMANASDTLLKAADHVTLHHDCDGVAYAFKNFLHVC
jgi:HAD superfamily hydrolase (TIGR01484 family)